MLISWFLWPAPHIGTRFSMELYAPYLSKLYLPPFSHHRFSFVDETAEYS